MGEEVSFELEPCPFCGRADDLDIIEVGDLARVECTHAGCLTAGPQREDAEHAAMAWNRRDG